MIIFYSKSCEGCSGNQALAKMQEHCNKQGVEFEARRTILWDRFEKEADKIMELNEGLELPFFYSTTTGETLKGYSLTPLDTLQGLIKKDKENDNKETI